MFKIESNFEEVRNQVSKKLNQVIQSDKVIRQAAFDAVALVSHRVQQEGKKTDDSLITSPANKKLGAYSYAYAKKRQNPKGSSAHQIDHIDLTFTGDMMGDFLPVPEGKTNWVVGFRGQKSSDKADWNEQKFGKIFNLSRGELKEVVQGIKNNINELLNK